jgi:hypothetical protein
MNVPLSGLWSKFSGSNWPTWQITAQSRSSGPRCHCNRLSPQTRTQSNPSERLEFHESQLIKGKTGCKLPFESQLWVESRTLQNRSSRIASASQPLLFVQQESLHPRQERHSADKVQEYL